MESVSMTESYREVLSWLRGGDMTPDPQMEDRFIEVMAALVQERIRTDEERRREKTAAERADRRKRLNGKVPSIRRIVDEMRAAGECDCTYEELMGLVPRKEETHAVSDTPKEETSPAAELDSYVLAKAIAYMGVLSGHLLNMSQIQMILYISYGVWLAGKGVRLTAEHPQMWQFGPVFPRVYGRFRKNLGDGSLEYDQLKRDHPEVLEFLSVRFRRHAWTKASMLTAPHVAEGTPWAETRKNSPDKFGAVIEDDLVRAWFAERLAGKVR